MARVSVSELKARLSRYLREVRRGGEVQVLDRGIPIARLVRIEAEAMPEADRREELIKSGILRPGNGGAGGLLSKPPLDVGVSISDALEKERSDRL